MKILQFLKKLILGIILLSSSSFTYALGLLEAYEIAKENDPVYLAAKSNFKSAIEVIPQARADLLPTLSGNASTTGNESNTENYITLKPYGKYNIDQYGINLSQPIIDYSLFAAFGKAREQVKSAHATMYAAELDLFIRVSSQYFKVLKAEDAMSYAIATRDSFQRHLDLTQERFRVGSIAITDVEEAKAKRDSAEADAIAARNDFANQKEIFRETLGVEVSFVQQLKKHIDLKQPIPNNIEEWVTRATQQNFSLTAFKFTLESFKKQMTIERTGHLPNVYVNGNVTNAKDFPGYQPTRVITKELGVNVNIPIFQGGKVISKQRQAAYNYQAKKEEFHQLTRKVQSNTRQSYRGVLTQISRVTALKQAVISSKVALKATEDAYKVGDRTIVQVLDSQTNVLNAEKNYAVARYDYLLEQLNLKSVTGILTIADLAYINSLLIDDKNNTKD